MRYTKDLQIAVCNDIEKGISIDKCSVKYSIPVTVIQKWCNLDITEEQAKVIALRKYQVEVSTAEAKIFTDLSHILNPDISDETYDKACNKLSSKLYALVAEIVKKERILTPREEPKTDAELIIEITDKWNRNQFIKSLFY